MVKKYTKGQIWEVIIIVAIILIVIYRFALVYDFVPDAYQPMTIFDELYDGLEMDLKKISESNDMIGRIAGWSLEHFKEIDKYVYEQEMRYKKAEEIADRCKENMIFRYFMYMGDEDNPNCTEGNLQLKEATKEVMQGAQKGSPPSANSHGPSAAAPSYGGINPSKGGSGNDQTININMHGNTPVTPENVAPQNTTPAPTAPAPVAPAITPAVTPTPTPVPPSSAPVSAPVAPVTPQMQPAPVQRPQQPVQTQQQVQPQAPAAAPAPVTSDNSTDSLPPDMPNRSPVSVAEPESVPTGTGPANN